MKIKVAVLGSTGMLGHVVTRGLASDARFEVLPFNRQHGSHQFQFDALTATFNRPLDVDYVINCAGVIWQAKNPSRNETFAINSAFPWKLQSLCSKSGAKLIHVSTDCVFSGKLGSYTEDASPDSQDDYGLSKFIGEPTSAMVIRSSIIGPELVTKRSLFEWARVNEGKTVQGFTNHLWNGLTTVEYTRFCRDIMLNDLYAHGIHHVFSNTVSKHDLLRLISDRFDLKLNIVPANTDQVDRTLATTKTLCQSLCIPSIETMIYSM